MRRQIGQIIWQFLTAPRIFGRITTAEGKSSRPYGKHRHEWVRVGYGGAGWSLYECACGAKEIDA